MFSGNHIWDKKEIYDSLNVGPNPASANYPPGNRGVADGGRLRLESVGVLNLQGQVFMPVR